MCILLHIPLLYEDHVDLLAALGAQKHTTPVLHPAVEPVLLLVYPQGTFVEAEVLA